MIRLLMMASCLRVQKIGPESVPLPPGKYICFIEVYPYYMLSFELNIEQQTL